jgi:hypothetical protein
MAIQSMWVPGYVARVETPGGSAVEDDRPMLNVDGVGSTDLIGLTQGMGIRFRGKAGHSNWFHFAVPTPTFRDNSDLPDPTNARQLDKQHCRVVRVFVLFNLLEPSARVKKIDVWDGPEMLQSGPALSVAGDRSTGIDESDDPMNANSWKVADEPSVTFGVGISALVEFGNVDGDVWFTAAGADFRV